MFNQATIVGNLTRDPEVRFTDNGNAVCKFGVATNERWTDKNGEKQEKATFHNIVVWGKQAEHCGQYLNKGRQVLIVGKIDNRSYDADDGTKKYISEIVAQRVQFLGGKADAAAKSDDDRIPVGNDDDGGALPF